MAARKTYETSTAVDIAGQRFGRLLAIAPTTARQGSCVVWRFVCDCGKECLTTAKSVRSGNSKSCGCLQIDATRALAEAHRTDKTCPTCSKTFECKLSHASKVTYCSKACMARAYTTRLAGAANPNYRGPEHAEKRKVEISSQIKLWRESNKDRVAAINRNAKARRKKAEGSHTDADIAALRLRQDGRCAICRDGLHGDGHVDHIIALASGGSNFVGNIQLLCAQCNLHKRTMLPIEYRHRVLQGADEEAEQARVMLWASINVAKYPALAFMFHAANGGFRTKTAAARMQMMGVKKGVPDLSLVVARGGYHGMFVELKVGKNKPTPEQAAWIAALTDQGYLAVVCYGAIAAIDAIKRYLALEVVKVAA